MRIFIFLTFLSCCLIASGQEKRFKNPSFGEHEYDMNNFIHDNIKYPVLARENGIGGVVVSSFIIDTSGNVDSITVLNNIDTSLNNEAIRIIKLSSGLWKPASVNDSLINVKFRWLITFKLDVEDEDEFRNATYYYNLGVKYAGMNDYQKAIYNFEQALIIDPKDIDALYNAAMMKFKMNDRNAACDYLHKIEKLGKPDADELLKKYCN